MSFSHPPADNQDVSCLVEKRPSTHRRGGLVGVELQTMAEEGDFRFPLAVGGDEAS